MMLKSKTIGYIATNEKVSITLLTLLNELGIAAIHKNGYIRLYKVEED